MKVLKIMDKTGDSRVEFGPDSKAEIEAKALFERMAKQGAAIFAVNRANGQTDKRVKDFSELENENVIVPRIVGG